MDFYGAKNLTLREVDQNYVANLITWAWRRKEKINWAESVRKKGVLQRGKEERNILHTVKEGNREKMY
jgi:hypothetical protein